MMNNICTQYQLRTEPCDAEARKYLKTFILWSLMLKNIEIQKYSSFKLTSVACTMYNDIPRGVAGSSLIKLCRTGAGQRPQTHPIIDNK